LKTLLIFSGGMDSATLLYDLVKKGDHVEALGFHYKQRHRKELFFASKLCQDLNVPFDVIDLSGIGNHLKGSSQTDQHVPVPFGKYDEPSMKLTVVPNRNMLMLAAAGAIAISRGFDRLAYGAHAGDHTIYPDCRPAFVEQMQKAFALCDWHQLELYAPYLDLTKGHICSIGGLLGVPFQYTWTCYVGKETPCQKCGACTERAEAFEFAGLADPLVGESV
jgi:7-cyano-7-deazaguanine synthase